MEKKNKELTQEKIRNWILKEEKEASQLIDDERLNEGIRQRILQSEKDKERMMHKHRRWIPAAAAAFLICSAGIISWQILSRPAEPDLFSTNMKRMIAKISDPGSIVMSQEYSFLETCGFKYSETNWTGSIDKAISKVNEELEKSESIRSPSSTLENIPHLNFKEKMRILIEEKQVHQVFYRYFQDLKEETNGSKSLSHRTGRVDLPERFRS